MRSAITRTFNITKKLSVVTSNLIIIPQVTLAIRKDHDIFSGVQGNKNIEQLYSKYSLHKTTINNSCCSGIPIYTPHPVWLRSIPYTKNTAIKGDIPIESCFALKIDVPGIEEYQNQIETENVNYNKLPILISTLSCEKYYRDINPFYFRFLIQTYIINDKYSKKDCLSSFLRNDINDSVLPSHTHIDTITFTDSTKTRIPIKLDVVIASDKELGIDEEWDKICEWANKS